MAALLMIVARDQPVLFEHLRDEFVLEKALTVVLDRRVGQRRQEAQPVRTDDRRADRRRHGIDEQLRAIGYAVVRTA